MWSLVAAHLSNREIAERLFLSVRTVESHVSSLMGKLRLADRRALARHAVALDAGAPRVGRRWPAAASSFVGRDSECAALLAAVSAHRMSIDNLLGARVVTADGAAHDVAPDRDPDLFWALRGGGGNFGVVTEFTFRLHPVGPQVYAGVVAYPFAQAAQVLRAWRDLTAAAPDELTVWTVLRKAPPLPFLPASAHGTEVVLFPLVHCGDLEAGERAAAPVLRFGDPLGSALGPTPYAGFQTAFDPLLTPGSRNYWKTHNFVTLPDASLDTLIELAGRLPGPECEIFVASLGGAMPD